MAGIKVIAGSDHPLSGMAVVWGRAKLVTLAFLGSIGMTMVILGCALPSYKSWWPFVVVVFYILAPLPTMFTKSYNDRTSNNVNMDLAIFITMGFVVSSFALPIVMARAPVHDPVIKWGACNLTLIGNVIVYLTYIGYFVTLYQEDSHYALRF